MKLAEVVSDGRSYTIWREDNYLLYMDDYILEEEAFLVDIFESIDSNDRVRSEDRCWLLTKLVEDMAGRIKEAS